MNFSENRSRNATVRVRTDANRFYDLSHAVRYSYGSDNKLIFVSVPRGRLSCQPVNFRLQCILEYRLSHRDTDIGRQNAECYRQTDTPVQLMSIIDQQTSTGCSNKNNPMGKIHHLRSCGRFLYHILVFTDGDSHQICSNIWFDLKIIAI